MVPIYPVKTLEAFHISRSRLEYKFPGSSTVTSYFAIYFFVPAVKSLRQP